MKSTGVMEIFYGHPWSEQARLEYAVLLKKLGMGFYIYGPKSDECLRKEWRAKPSPEIFAKYKAMKDEFSAQGIRFGLVLSPHGIDSEFDLAARRALQEKVKVLSDLGLDYFGLFFDDMKSASNLAERQIEIAEVVAAATPAKLIFCPSFYCNDPLLDMLFGDRPEHYLQTLGRGLSKEIEILWTGEQIISPEISVDHLNNVAEILQRKPFICDNFYADDGPMNCGFLRLVPPTGRPREAFSSASHWAFNPMNQAHLSRLVLHSIEKFIIGKMEPQAAFEAAVASGAPKSLADFILKHASAFASSGLEPMSEVERAQFVEQLSKISIEPCAIEIIKWLEGYYAVDFTAMIEQSCYVG